MKSLYPIQQCLTLLICSCNAINTHALKHDPDERPLRAPSRPPAPLLSSTTASSITVLFKLDPIDHKYPNNGDSLVDVGEIYFYETQVEKTEKDFKADGLACSEVSGAWKSFGDSLKPSKLTGYPSTFTLSNLNPNEGHRFRVRAVNSVGASVWSSPSQIFKTKSFTPPSPDNLSIIEIYPSHVHLSWNAQLASKTTSYHLQYRRHFFGQIVGDAPNENNNQFQWTEWSQNISPFRSKPLPEIQVVTTLVNPDSHISTGYFWLQLDIPIISQFTAQGEHNMNLHSKYTSEAIPYNATSQEFQDAIQNIKGIGEVHVFRYGPDPEIYSDFSQHGSFTWQIEFDISTVNMIKSSGIYAAFPLFLHYKNTLNGDYGGEAMDRVRVKRLQPGSEAKYKQKITEIVTKLESYTHYDFRVRAKNEFGYSKWSILENIRTKTIEYDPRSNFKMHCVTNNPFVKLLNGEGRLAANRIDSDYHIGCAMGGRDANSGGDGLVAIISSGEGQTKSARTYFYFNSGFQNYIVPGGYSSGYAVNRDVRDRYVTIKAWGAGGAGGLGPNRHGNKTTLQQEYERDFSNGGGGGYAEARIQVTPGETLRIVVGGGGKSQESPPFSLDGGYNGGGDGGRGTRGSGGGGGGMSAVYRESKIILAAGGGGGGGATDYCCAHGGAGGGKIANNGGSTKTPRDLTNDNITTGEFRNEFTPLDCNSEECIDERDTKGLPANHAHLERGFAPNASYSVLATGGFGGSESTGGNNGISGNYIIYEVDIDSLPGGYGSGGKGGDGKDGGGGGGSGIMGGGGGGSGVDGAGGGGGSGYINAFSIHEPYNRGYRNLMARPEPPLAFSISHDSFWLSWETNYKLYEVEKSDITAYDVEVSQGTSGSASDSTKAGCSDDFIRFDHVVALNQSKKFEVSINGLDPRTHYCVRIVALFLSGISKRSDSTLITTMSLPINQWKWILPRAAYEMRKKSAKLMFSIDTNSCETQLTPSPRRGQSLTYLNRKLYLFGGVIEGCSCTEKGDLCGDKSTFSNDLWVLDIPTKEWYLVETSNPSPEGREQHSAVVMPDEKILIMGGIGKNATVYGDIWILDMGRTHSRTIEGSRIEMLPIVLTDTSVIRHTTVPSITIREHEKLINDICLVNVNVEVSISHECIEQIQHIKLFGPQTSMKHQPNLQRGSGRMAKLYVGQYSPFKQCTPSNITILFSDSSAESVLDWKPKISGNFTFKPAESLVSTFKDTSVNGEWTIEIYDSIENEHFGRLVDWKLNMNFTACNQQVTWKQMSDESCKTSHRFRKNFKYSDCDKNSKQNIFTPRYAHSSVVVDNNVFVIGGSAGKHLLDLLKYDYLTNTWQRLNGSSSPKLWNGQSASLTPWGIFQIGGVNLGTGQRSEDRIMLYDLVHETTKVIDSPKQVGRNDGISFESRYLLSSSLIGVSNTVIHPTIFDDEPEPMLVIFGGDDGIRYLNDLWILRLREFTNQEKHNNEQKRNAACEWRLTQNSTALKYWRESCDPKAELKTLQWCRWSDILLMAWCKQQYQSFLSPF